MILTSPVVATATDVGWHKCFTDDPGRNRFPIVNSGCVS